LNDFSKLIVRNGWGIYRGDHSNPWHCRAVGWHDMGIVGYRHGSEVVIFIVDLKTAAQSEDGEEEKYTLSHEMLVLLEITLSEYLNGEKIRSKSDRQGLL